MAIVDFIHNSESKNLKLANIQRILEAGEEFAASPRLGKYEFNIDRLDLVGSFLATNIRLIFDITNTWSKITLFSEAQKIAQFDIETEMFNRQGTEIVLMVGGLDVHRYEGHGIGTALGQLGLQLARGISEMLFPEYDVYGVVDDTAFGRTSLVTRDNWTSELAETLGAKPDDGFIRSVGMDPGNSKLFVLKLNSGNKQ